MIAWFCAPWGDWGPEIESGLPGMKAPENFKGKGLLNFFEGVVGVTKLPSESGVTFKKKLPDCCFFLQVESASVGHKGTWRAPPPPSAENRPLRSLISTLEAFHLRTSLANELTRTQWKTFCSVSTKIIKVFHQQKNDQ